jgi:hypothetical protein
MRNHYIITRFNLRSIDWKQTKNGDLVLTDLWLKERFQIFEDFCLPSVQNQSNQSFKWCVFFDIETPEKHQLKISEIHQKYSNFRPIYIDGMKNLNKEFIKYIKDTLDVSDKYIITSRLDNDDIIHKDFVEVIQNNYFLEPNTIIDLRKGYQVAIETKNTQIRSIDFQFNQFVSLVEAVDTPIKTVMDKMHREWKKNLKVNIYTKNELWIELIHVSNKVNSVRKEFKRVYDFNNSDFGISKEFEFKENRYGVCVNNIYLILKEIKRKVFKRVKMKLNKFKNG